ncbi:MAG: hypothetical protein AAF705_20205, partial [Bacteroidota bacterium]
PRTAREIVTDLQAQGFAERQLRGFRAVKGIAPAKGTPCNNRKLEYQKFSLRKNGLDVPLKNEYWVTIGDRKTMLIVRRNADGYQAYGAVRFVKQVDSNTYSIREVFCYCTNCVEKDGDLVTIYYCGLEEANTPSGYKCTSASGRDCNLVDQTKYFCGVVVFD